MFFLKKHNFTSEETGLPAKCAQAGLSVIEVLVGMFILTLVGLASYSFQKSILSQNKIISGGLTAQDEARRALKIMSAEIRTVSPASTGSYAIAQTATSSFIFYSNIDGDSFKERIRYFIDGATLKKGVIKPTGNPLTYNPANETVSELARDVANAATAMFRYYDTNYDGTTGALPEPINISAVRLVKITLVIDKDPSALPSPLTLTTQISMRNLKDNL